MMPPCEMMSKSFLPAFRGLVSYELKSLGYSQLKIASVLGLTQSAISQLLSKPKSTYVKTLLDMGLNIDEINSLVKLITRDILRDPVRTTLTLYSFWMDALSRGVFCDYHRRMYPQLSSCEICLQKKIGLQDTERIQVLARLEKAVKLIEESRYFVNVMPQVAVNIVESIRDAKTLEDIAGVPGRIVALHDKPKAVSKPEFGGSRHLAKVLLAVKRFSPHLNSVINLKFDSLMEETVKSLGLKYSETKKNILVGRETEEAVIESVSEEFKKAQFLDVVFDRGGYGIEPITYVFGEDSLKVVEKALKIARKYVEINAYRSFHNRANI